MFPAKHAQLGERVFFSVDVCHLASVTPRQLQWWDERKLVSPQKQDHRRIYKPQHVVEILTVAALRRKGMSFPRIRRVLRLMRGELGKRLSAGSPGQAKLYLITDGKSVQLEEQPDLILDQLSNAEAPMFLVSISDQIKRLSGAKIPRRYLAKQLQLF